MATAKNDILKPLKRICAQIEAEENIEECFDEIETFASKGAFHEHHTFMELLGIVQRKAKLKKLITSEIFKFFGSILQDGNGSKDSFLCLIYNFLVKSTVSLQFQFYVTVLSSNFVFLGPHGSPRAPDSGL